MTSILEEEARLTAEAPQRYGEFYTAAMAVTDLLDTATLGVRANQPSAAAVLATIRKNVRLALLSAIRRHRVQATACLRQALEFTPVLGYVMLHHEAALAIYVAMINSDDPRAQEAADTKLRSAARNWISDSLPSLSKMIKDGKDAINMTSSHAGLVSTVFSLQLSPSGFGLLFFDAEELIAERLGLMETTRTAMLAALVLQEVNRKSGTFQMAADFDEKLNMTVLKLAAVGEEFDRLYPRD